MRRARIEAGRCAGLTRTSVSDEPSLRQSGRRKQLSCVRMPGTRTALGVVFVLELWIVGVGGQRQKVRGVQVMLCCIEEPLPHRGVSCHGNSAGPRARRSYMRHCAVHPRGRGCACRREALLHLEHPAATDAERGERRALRCSPAPALLLHLLVPFLISDEHTELVDGVVSSVILATSSRASRRVGLGGSTTHAMIVCRTLLQIRAGALQCGGVRGLRRDTASGISC